MWLSLLQHWVYQHFRGIESKDVWSGYRDDQHPCAMLFVPHVGMSTPDEYRGHLDELDLLGVVMAPYGEHRQTCSFERISLYSGLLKNGNRKVRYLSEWVLRKFGYI